MTWHISESTFLMYMHSSLATLNVHRQLTSVIGQTSWCWIRSFWSMLARHLWQFLIRLGHSGDTYSDCIQGHLPLTNPAIDPTVASSVSPNMFLVKPVLGCLFMWQFLAPSLLIHSAQWPQRECPHGLHVLGSTTETYCNEIKIFVKLMFDQRPESNQMSWRLHYLPKIAIEFLRNTT